MEEWLVTLSVRAVAPPRYEGDAYASSKTNIPKYLYRVKNFAVVAVAVVANAVIAAGSGRRMTHSLTTLAQLRATLKRRGRQVLKSGVATVATSLPAWLICHVPLCWGRLGGRKKDESTDPRQA
jgi:hypothetical protein